MFGALFRFELRSHFRRPTTWLYVAIMFFCAFFALSTDAQPLIPQAHGMKCDLVWCNIAMPTGNGMPIKNASGAARKKAEAIRIISGKDIIVLLINGSSMI